MADSHLIPIARGQRWWAGVVACALIAVSVATTPASAATSLGTYRDNFSIIAYTSSQGSIDWSGSPWIEQNDDNSAWSGSFRIGAEPHCTSILCLIVGKDGNASSDLTRTADLSAADTAMLSFKYKRHVHGGGSGFVRLEISQNGGSWAPLQTFNLDGTDDAGVDVQHDITSWISSTTMIRLSLNNATDASHINFDDLQIELFANDNYAPVLDAIADATIDEEALFGFTATASDANAADNLVFSLDGTEPPGASMSAAGAFTWTPSEAQGPGIYSFDVVVTDDGSPAMTDSQTVTLTVEEVNAPPTVSPIGPQSTLEGSLLAFVVSGSDVETPANDLVFSLNGAVPAGAGISPGGVFTWTPTESQGPGTFAITVVVTDNGVPAQSDTETVAITVSEKNEVPTIAPIANVTVPEGDEVTFVASVTDPDLPANDFTYGLSGAPPGATLSATGVFSWTPTDEQGPGVYPFDIVVTDDGDPARADTESVTITVTEANIAPAITPVPDQTVAEGSPLSVLVSAVDPDTPANSFDFSLSGAPAGADISSGGVLTWTPTEAQGPGTYHFDVVATDDGVPSMAGSTSVSVTVTEVNTAPILSPITSRTVDEGRLFSLQASATDADSPGNQLMFSLVGAPAGATISPNGLLSWTPNETQGPGTHIFQVFVADDGIPSLSDSQTVTIHVIDANNAPVIDPIGVVNAIEGQPTEFTATAVDPDTPANTFSFRLSGGVPAGASITPSGKFTWTPGETHGPGVYTFDVMVTDDGTPARSSYESVTIEVAEANQPPIFDLGDVYEVEAGLPYLLIVAATDPDLPTQTLSYTASGLPEGATMAVTGELRWYSGADAVGARHVVRITATDDGTPALAATSSITLKVITANVAPELQPVGDKEVISGELLRFTVRASDSDGSPGDLRYSLGGDVPVGASINPTSGVFQWRPSLAHNDADHRVSIIVTDGGAVPKSDSEMITITVGQPNVAPVLTRPPNQTSTPGDTVAIVIGSADPDGYPGPLIHSADNLPPGLSIDEITGAISGEPGFDGIAGSPYTVTVSVTDGRDEATAEFIWEVKGVADPLTTTPGKKAVVATITEPTTEVGVPIETGGTVGRSLVLMSRAAREGVSEISAPLLLLLLIVGAFMAFGRVGLFPLLRRGAKHDGILRRLDFDTGAGLVHRTSDGADVFVHISAIARRDRAVLAAGDLVTFRTVDGAYRDLVTKLRRRR